MKHAKKRIKKLGLSGQGKVRINKAGCLDRCEEGPVVVVYPQGTWYTYVDTATSTTSSTSTSSAAKWSSA
jgi:NADH:ubiquinone oxidoreductase subunit E